MQQGVEALYRKAGLSNEKDFLSSKWIIKCESMIWILTLNAKIRQKKDLLFHLHCHNFTTAVKKDAQATSDQEMLAPR